MKKVGMCICIILLLISSGCSKNNNNSSVKDNKAKQEEVKETQKNKENKQILEIDKRTDAIFIEKHTGTQIIDDEIKDIKLILSGMIYCYEHFQDPNIINNKDESEKTRNLFVQTVGAITHNAAERGNNKITDEDSVRSIISAAASVYGGMGVYVYGKFEETGLEEMNNRYMESLKKAWIALDKCFNIEYDNELQKYFEVKE